MCYLVQSEWIGYKTFGKLFFRSERFLVSHRETQSHILDETLCFDETASKQAISVKKLSHWIQGPQILLRSFILVSVKTFILQISCFLITDLISLDTAILTLWVPHWGTHSMAFIFFSCHWTAAAVQDIPINFYHKNLVGTLTRDKLNMCDSILGPGDHRTIPWPV